MTRNTRILAIVAIVVFSTIGAMAQENRSELSFQGMGFFTSGTNGNGTGYSATEAGGVLGTYRYHLNHWASVEAAYGFSLNTQRYDFLSSNPFRIQTDIHQFTGSLVMNLPTHGHSRINPYLLNWRRRAVVRADRQSVQFDIECAVADQGDIRVRRWRELCDPQRRRFAGGVSRAFVRHARFRIWSLGHERGDAHGRAVDWNQFPFLRTEKGIVILKAGEAGVRNLT